MAIRVYVVEDHPVMRETLVAYVDVNRDLELCGAAETAEQALHELPAARPALILLDISLPDRSGLDILPAIRSMSEIPCIILSGYRDEAYVEQALAAGARGYVLKGSPRELPAAIEAVMNGGIYVSQALGGVEWGEEHGIQNTESGIQNKEYRIQETE